MLLLDRRRWFNQVAGAAVRVGDSDWWLKLKVEVEAAIVACHWYLLVGH